MNQARCIGLFVLLSVLGACDANFGESVVRESVHIYFLEPISNKQAVQLADFWEEKQLSQGKVQYLQLSETDSIIRLKLIANDSTFLTDIPFDVQIELFKLDSLLTSELFINRDVELFISDRTFTKAKSLD